MKRHRLSIAVITAALLIASAGAIAEQTPPRGRFDSRVRIINYNPDEVVKIRTFYGVSTHIKFGADETIKHVAVGDSLAWKIVPADNNLFIKPQEQEADTNVTVVTNKRDYNFVIVVAKAEKSQKDRWSDRSLIYSLKFHYPDEEAKALAAKFELEKEKAESQKTVIALGESENHAEKNYGYYGRGDSMITPIRAYDDGRFIYLSFRAISDLPAIYEEDEQGNESLINTNVIDTNTVVVHKLVENLVLRAGLKVSAVKNANYAATSMGQRENRTRTAVDSVKRTLKGNSNE